MILPAVALQRVAGSGSGYRRSPDPRITTNRLTGRTDTRVIPFVSFPPYPQWICLVGDTPLAATAVRDQGEETP